MKVLIIGGGVSGLMASVSAAQNGSEVILLEKNSSLGRKLLLTGGGRCNVTSSYSRDEIISHIPGNGKFLYSVLSQFDNLDIINFFQSRGVELKEEDHGRMFPKTNSAESILNVFIDEIKKRGIYVKTKAKVNKLIFKNGKVKGVVLKNGEKLYGDAIILAVGGMTFPNTGSTGDGYKLAKSVGHEITKPFPVEVPLTSNEVFIKNNTLKGLSLRNISLSVLNKKGKVMATQNMDLIFTHFGISGPSALRCSYFVHKEQEKSGESEVTLSLNSLPKITHSDLADMISKWKLEPGGKSIKKYLKSLLPERYVEFLLQESKINSNMHIKSINKTDQEKINELIHNFKFNVNGTLPIEKAFVTGGGVNLREVNPKTLESKLVDGLYICGELLDINGFTGGYNVTSAFSTGYVAGKHAALGE